MAAEPETINPEAPEVGETAAATRMDGEGGFGAPTLNLLHPSDSQPEALVAAVAAVDPETKPKGRVWRGAVAAVAVVAALGGGGYYLYAQTTAQPKVAVASPTPSLAVTPSPTPTSTPAATPSPTPTPIPAAANVTAPAAVPTSDHPQAVTVKSPSGLWLRSSASSSNKQNIIGWIPNGGTVSVDAVGEFWWHGTYGGKVGYFASNYTK